MALNNKILRLMKEFAGRSSVAIWADYQEQQTENSHADVNKYVEEHGGEALSGWIYSDVKALEKVGIFQFVFHTVWKSPKGKVFDISPSSIRQKKNVFWPDQTRRFDDENKRSYVNALIVTENAHARKFEIPLDTVNWYNGSESCKLLSDYDGMCRTFESEENIKMFEDEFGAKYNAETHEMSGLNITPDQLEEAKFYWNI